MKAVHKFLDGGDKVKVTLRFRGREMAHVELGAELLSRVRGDVDDFANRIHAQNGRPANDDGACSKIINSPEKT